MNNNKLLKRVHMSQCSNIKHSILKTKGTQSTNIAVSRIKVISFLKYCYGSQSTSLDVVGR